MKNAEKIENYIKECFAENHLDYIRYFGIIDGDEITEGSLIGEDGKINLKAVKRAAEILGMDEKDILDTNEDKILFRWKRYYYLQHICEYEYASEKADYGDGYDEQRMLEVIFGSEAKGPYPPKYNIHSVAERLIKLLKKYDEVKPGTYHKGASIKNLSISTVNFCHYKGIEKLLNSYIEMAEKMFDLFIAGIHKDLSEEEIKEYNFLVSQFGLRDRAYPGAHLHYSSLVNCRAFYQDVCRANMYDYIKLDRMQITPWACADFVLNKKLVRKYLNVFPQMKWRMREFAMDVSKFTCIFMWSDDEMKQSTTDFWDDFFDVEDEEEILLPKRVFVAKTPEELAGDDKTAEILLGYCRSEKLGGLKVYCPREHSSIDNINRMKCLFGKIRRNNFFDGKSDTVGGGTDE